MSAPLFQQVLETPLFENLSQLEAAALFGISEEKEVAHGVQLFAEGDPGECLYVLLEGEVEVLKGDPGGQTQRLATLGAGAVIGEMSLLGKGNKRSASAVALTQVRLVTIPSDRFCQLVAEQNLAALKVVHNLAQEMSQRLMEMNDRLVEVLNRTKRKDEVLDFQRLLANWSF